LPISGDAVVSRSVGTAGLAIGLAFSIASCGRDALTGRDEATATHPTFASDVAPLLYANCVPCHHEGGAGPFPLIRYRDISRRARQIVKVTGRRFMPPWPPVAGHGTFVGERRLTDSQIDLLARWVQDGAPEGDASATPPPPRFTSTWQLGKPDLILTAPPGFTLPAEGGDQFHNFVLANPLTATRFVRAIEILPGKPRLVHHANILLDPSGWSRARDAEDPGVGFPGMDLEIVSTRFEPESHFLFWKLGSPPAQEPDDMAWRLEPGTDLVLNMHLRPSGKPEEVRPSIGLYFTDKAPTRFPMLLQLEHDGALDIPPGETSFTVSDQLELPVDVTLLAVYPHAHYLGHEIRGTARLPDGTTRWLVHITDWDLNWQAVYRLQAPMFLPKGTVVSMKWTYDNSSANVRNPHTPPERVKNGDRASDEMGHLWLQVLPSRPEDRLLLQEALMRSRLRKYPDDFVAEANLGSVLESAGRYEEAIEHLERAVIVRPKSAPAHNMLGTAYQAMGQSAPAATEFRTALRLDPASLDAAYNLGNALLAQNQPADAVACFQRVLRANPNDAAALSDLGSAYAMLGQFDQAVASFERSIQIRPANALAHYNLGLIAVRRGRLAEAKAHFERSLAVDPSSQDARRALDELTGGLGRK
jgi:Flp pilus assembly protein TadD